MTRTENDLRDALDELERRADEHGTPPVAALTGSATEDRGRGPGASTHRRVPRWIPPLAAAAVVAGAAVTAAVMSDSGSTGTTQRHDSQPAARPTVAQVAPSFSAAVRSVAPSPTAATILDDAAAKLDAAPAWSRPASSAFFYVRTTESTTWTSVSGRLAGGGRTAEGAKIWVSGCHDGQIVSTGEGGSCTLNDVPHYLADAPTTPSAWDAYLERMAPGARAANAQGKIIVQVLHQDLTAPRSAAALLRYTASCAGLHLITVAPVAGEKLTGVTCTSMTNGSYGLAFDATTHEFVGFVGVGLSGVPDGPAEIVETAGIVAAVGRTP